MSAIALPKLELTGELALGAGVALIALVALYFVVKNAGSIGSAAGKAAGDAAAGVIVGLGDSVGVPRTDQDECSRAIEEGRTLDASFACPAGRFLGSLFGGGGAPKPVKTAGGSGTW